MNKNLQLLAAAALIPLVATALACGGVADSERPAARAPLVEALPARAGALPIEEVLPGMVRARNQVLIRPEISGRVIEVRAESGEAVRRGQPLVRLDDSEARERLRGAEADVRLAEAAAAASRARAAELAMRVERTRALAQQELVSAQELESLEAQLAALEAGARESEARVEQARATLEERRSELAKSLVRAPVGGRLGERRAEVGMLVGPADVLFEVGDLDELIVEVNLTEEMLARVATGQTALIESRDRAAEPVRAELARISPFLAEASFTARGEIDVDNREGRLRPGMFVSVRILVGESRRATLVPVSAIWEDPESGVRGVFVVEDAEGLESSDGALPAAAADTPERERAVAFHPVEVLARGRGATAVAGIDEGAWVVTVGQHLLAAERRAGAGDEIQTATARVRPTSWSRVTGLEQLQNEDLLEGFLDKQRKVAAALGAEIPESEEVVEQVLREAAEADGGPGVS